MKRRLLGAAIIILATATCALEAQGEERVLEVRTTSSVFHRLVSESRPADSEIARGEILASNPGLKGLEVWRDGSRVTVSFVPNGRDAPSQLFLVGSKRDFLLLAMSENPQEALERLSGLDPEMRSAVGSKSGSQLTLRLSYATDGRAAGESVTVAAPASSVAQADAGDGPTFDAARGKEEALQGYLDRFPSGRHAAEAELELEALRTARMQAEYEAVMASGDPQALQDFMARWADGTKVNRSGRETRLQVRGPTAPFPTTGSDSRVASEAPPAQAPAPPAEPPEPAAPTAEELAEEAYDTALATGSVEALEQFVAAHPAAAQASAAKLRLAELRQEAAFQMIVKENTVDGYRGFLVIFPDSPRRAEIEARIRALTAEKRNAEAVSKARVAEASAQAAARERRARAYDEARRMDAPEAYRIILATYPGTAEADEAQKRLMHIEADREAFETSRSSESKLERYLAENPGGRFAAEARKDLKQLRDVRMEAEYQAARAGGSVAALEGFLRQWPGSTRAPQAKARLQALLEERQRADAVAAAEKAAQAKAAEEEKRAAKRAAEPAAPSPLRLPVRRVSSKPKVDGEEDPLWRSAAGVDVPVKGPRGGGKVRLKAVHDGSAIYFLVVWEDPSRDEIYRPWAWDARAGSYQQLKDLDDAFAVSLYRDSASPNTCMLNGEPIDADLWLWRAGWGALSSLADDGWLKVSRERTPRSNPYPTRSGQGHVWISQDWDQGTSGWSLFIPVDHAEDTIPSYRGVRAEGSRGDVQAAGSWDKAGGGRWRVEFARALDTGHADDVPVELGATQVVALAVYDKSDRADHASSPPVFLDVQPR